MQVHSEDVCQGGYSEQLLGHLQTPHRLLIGDDGHAKFAISEWQTASANDAHQPRVSNGFCSICFSHLHTPQDVSRVIAAVQDLAKGPETGLKKFKQHIKKGT